MIREPLKDAAYFKEYLSFEYERLQKRQELIRKVISQRGEDDSVKKAYLSVLSYCMNIINAEYASGGSCSTIRGFIQNTIPEIRNTSFQHRYVELLWLLSLSVCLDIDEARFEQLIEIKTKNNISDAIADFIAASRKKALPPQSEQLLFPVPYQSLLEVIKLAATDKHKSVERLRQYLEKEWYTGHSDSGWYDSHKSKEDTYAGYWSWESAALVKILQLDDQLLKGQRYYPYDILHCTD